MAMDSADTLSDQLLKLRALLDRAPASAADAVERIRARLSRDLLVRLGEEPSFLIVGIVGPNNAGKSTLFTQLSGTQASPPDFRGGFTQNLIGAGHPALLERLAGTAVLERFDVRLSGPSPGAPPQALFLSLSPAVPRHLLLIDSPDFDSIYAQNKAAADALVVGADVLIVVVTRSTYNNRLVHDFISDAVRHGRPHILIYNEAEQPEHAAAHLDAIVQSTGSEPLARYFAPHDVSLQRGEGALALRRLPDGAPFDLHTLGEGEVRALARQARRSSLARLVDDAAAMRLQWQRTAEQASRAEGRAGAAALRLGEQVAEVAFPVGPLVEAFRAVLDRRGGVHALARQPVRQLSAGLKSVRQRVWSEARRALGQGEGRPPPTADDSIHEHERQALQQAAPAFIEALLPLSESIDPVLDPELHAALESDLEPAQIAGLAGRIAARLASEAVIPEAYRASCEREVERLLDERGDRDLQWVATVLASVPAAAMTAEIVLTGGIGLGDLGAAAATAATSPLWQWMIDKLGRELVDRVRRDWIAERGALITEAALAGTLTASRPLLERRRTEWSEAVSVIDALQQSLKDPR
ncbi:MAG: hypothetical protein ACI8S6_002252 [Myxococcota bacterium]|jgi:hypothetical protein